MGRPKRKLRVRDRDAERREVEAWREAMGRYGVPPPLPLTLPPKEGEEEPPTRYVFVQPVKEKEEGVGPEPPVHPAPPRPNIRPNPSWLEWHLTKDAQRLEALRKARMRLLAAQARLEEALRLNAAAMEEVRGRIAAGPSARARDFDREIYEPDRDPPAESPPRSGDR